MTPTVGARASTRDRIVHVAASLLREHGRAAVTTRGVAEKSGVQAPTIYRLFGDKDGLLEAVAEHVMAAFAFTKASAVAAAAAANVDPVEDLRTGWDMTIEFGVANPGLFILLSDPTHGQRSPAAQAGRQLLADRVHRVAQSGRLRISEDRAVELIHAAGTGAILTTLSKPPAERDHRLANTMFDAVLDQILTPTSAPPEASTGNLVAQAVSLRARAAEAEPLSQTERALLTEWLDRIIDNT